MFGYGYSRKGEMTSSKKLKNQMRGAQAQAAGSTFETHFKCRCNSLGITWVQIPTGAFKTPFGWKPKKSPFDFVIGKNSMCAGVDAKTIQSGNFPHSKIDRNQLDHLNQASRCMASGYIVWFRDVDKVVYFPTRILNSVAKRESLKWEQGIYLGPFDNYRLEIVLKDQPQSGKTTLFE